MRVFQLLELPELLEADALYFILNGDYAESYLTDDNGVAKFIGNTSMIENLAPGGATTVAELTDATTYDFPTLNTPVSDALAAKANSADLGSIATFEGNQNLRTTDPATFAAISGTTGTFTGNVNVGAEIVMSSGGGNDGFLMIDNSNIGVRSSGQPRLALGSQGITVNNLGFLGWSPLQNLGSGATPDTAFTRVSAGLIALGTGAVGNTSGSLNLTNLTASGTVTAAGINCPVFEMAQPTFEFKPLNFLRLSITTTEMRPNISGTYDLGRSVNKFKDGFFSGAVDTRNLTASGTVKTGSLTVAVATASSSATAVAAGAGASVYITDETGGATLAVSDGTVWRRVSDRASIS